MSTLALLLFVLAGATSDATPAASPGAAPGATPAASPGAAPGATPGAAPDAAPGAASSTSPTPAPAAQPAPAPTPAPAAPSLTGGLTEDAFKALHELRSDAPPALHGVDIELAGGKAYLSLPPGAKGPLPGVIVIQEWWGLNVNIKHWADRLAADGYAALAVDLYDGTVATTRDAAMGAMQSVKDERALEILHAAHGFLQTDPRIRAPRTASIGWCFGGGWSLKLALAEPELDACVIYYGQLETDPAALGRIQASVLGVFGTRDAGIPQATVDAFDQGLAAAGVTHRILRYDAEHAFANPSSARYDGTSAGAAWAEARTFLAQSLVPASAP